MGNFIMTVGIPGGGKSTKSLEYADCGAVVVSSDEIRKELGLRDGVARDNEICFGTLNRRVMQALCEGHDVVYDATNMSRRRRMETLKRFRGHADRYICLLFTTPVDTCISRDMARERTVGKEVIHKMLCAFNPPWYYEGWDEIICIKNEIPASFAFEDMDQNNPHHTMTVQRHMDAACRYAKEHFNRNEVVIRAAQYHDIGKYVTQTTDRNGISHYYGHENAGAYMFLSQISEPAMEDLYVANLIGWHMAPLMSWQYSKEAEKKNRQQLGEKMYNDIMRLNEADAAAH